MLGKYERLDILGHGASGIVYLAQDTLLKKRVAIKEVNAQGEEQQRVLEEARVLDRLRHPNIVAVNSVDTINGKVVIDMEYIHGSNLLEILRTNDGPLPIADCVNIAAQICDGLAFAHAHRTIHRDIKPANILVSDQHVVKLADFGLAQVLGTNSYAGGAGTFAYMAPEDFQEGNSSDRQSDIWAVGVILYETLTGVRPFTVANPRDPFAWARAVSTEDVQPPSKYDAAIPPALDRICLRALQRNKEERYMDAGEMALDLRSVFVVNEPSTLPFAGFSEPVNPLLSSWLDIDGLIKHAPEHWDVVAEMLDDGSLTAWLRRIDEPLLADVASELQNGTEENQNTRLRDFLYRAGMEIEAVGRAAFMQGSDQLIAGNYESSVELLQRAVRLDSARPSYYLKLAQAARLAGDIELMRETLISGISLHPKDRALKQLLTEIGGATPEISPRSVDFGVLHHGEIRTLQVSLKGVGTDIVKGRIASSPGWLAVTPLTFNGKSRQLLKLEADSSAVHSETMAYSEVLSIETTGGNIQLPVSVSVVPERPSFARIMFWYVPVLLLCCAPFLAGAEATIVMQGRSQEIALLPSGLIASGLSFSAFRLVNWIVDTKTLEKLIASIGMVLLPLGLFVLGSQASVQPSGFSAIWPLGIEALAVAFIAPALQGLAFFRFPGLYSRWQIWCVVICITSLASAGILWNAMAQ
jgi:serine/threonine protein kinase